jgi:ribosomal protein S18 acetylase RimI-like enzyme
VTAPHPLDNPVRSSLAGPHARFAERRGNVLRYPADVSPFLALPDQPDAADWADVAALAGPGALVALAGVRMPPPDGWEVTLIGEGVQLVDHEVEATADGEAVRLGPGDVPEMLELAGERLHPPGWTEISAVCTDDAWRGLGFASRLVRALVASIRARGETAFLHARRESERQSVT